MITKTYFKVYRTLPDPDYFFIKNEYNGDNTITFNFTSSVFTSANTEYRIGEDGEWTAFVFGSSKSVTLPANTKLYLRGTDWVRKGASSVTISPSLNVSLGGCIMSLIDYKNIDSLTTIPNYAFYYFFSNKALRADFNFGNVTRIGDYGCYGMFAGCTSLTTAPDMSNITSIGNHGCREMFLNCKSLTTAPDMSKVTSIGNYGCYGMFNGCSLSTAPDMSNVTSIDNQGCSFMFSGCTKLNYVYAPSVSSWSTNNFSSWLNNVASYGIVRKKSSLTIPSGASGVPTGWDVENY